ncbi:hypothetical protein LSH36_613g00010 [Paralvinella palmiformis]|uniref:SAC domain-containing protein n=1 Tax=Paralvinella palmiformis TaxID=53620 RepID=A0AAD9J4A2_9ANNE|nr:hypothetical protein LSH36_613g00010 [Paralvinella palmiformis]
MQFPIISCTQKIVIYETKARFFVVGSNNTETRFRVLKIDRTEPRDLIIVDDKIEYTRKEIRDLLLMIDVGNRPKQHVSGLTRTVSAFGIVGRIPRLSLNQHSLYVGVVEKAPPPPLTGEQHGKMEPKYPEGGFIRFLEGYYVILITKRKRVALIGSHFIFKIEDTSMLYIPNDETVRYPQPDEQRYLRMFQNVDLSSNFYFSYSYDLTHTLQYNMSPCKGINSETLPQSPETELKFWNTWNKDSHIHDSGCHHQDIEDASAAVRNFLDKVGRERKNSSDSDKSTSPDSDNASASKSSFLNDFVYGIKTEPTWKYIWNLHLLKPVQGRLHPDWMLYTTHGFIGQSRDHRFAPHPLRYNRAFFSSNQATGKGYVANEVETEQIVHNAQLTSLHHGSITSFVQHRGSIPLFWSQDISKMVPKPLISMDQADPYGYVAGLHFNQVLRRYGSPIIILNLVKKREKKKHESILSEEIVKSLQYLNQFLPPEHAIKYIGFDMARVSKSKKENVLLRLEEIAEYCVKKIGFLHCGKNLYCNELRPHPRCHGMQNNETELGRKQQGIIRTNCVDCLDRTNTAQFAIGKCALAFQLHALGVLDEPYLKFDTDCVRMLEDLYEDQGDALAVQYGGSQLVHRIKGYRKIAPWTSSSRDIMHTLSRYYSNAFSDADKQHAINLFLGIYEPKVGDLALWDYVTDFYMHNKVTLVGPTTRERRYTQWWELSVVRSLPFAYDEEGRGLETKPLTIKTHREDERVNYFWEYYKPYELTSLDDLYSFTLPNSCRDFMPKFANSYSPFAPRVRPGRRKEEFGVLDQPLYGQDGSIFSKSTPEANPNVSGKESTTSVSSTGSEGSTSSSEGSDIDGDLDIMDDLSIPKEESGLSYLSLKDLFPTMEQTYGVDIHPPSKESITTYKKFVDIGNRSNQPIEIERGVRKAGKSTELVQRSIFPLDSIYNVEPPKVSQHSREIYKTYIQRANPAGQNPSKRSMQSYHQYVFSKYM